MRRSFEELVGFELDRLYRAALFLVGGSPQSAERLVTTTVLQAHREYAALVAEPDESSSWLLDCLARRLLAGEPASNSAFSFAERSDSLIDDGKRRDADPRSASLPSKIDVQNLAEVAVSLPHRHRIAFWFAVVERRRYRAIAEILGEPRSHIARRIRESHRMIVVALARSEADGEGAAGAVP